MSTPRIFVSHSHEDDSFCLGLIADLRARLGEDAVWFDSSGGLQAGDDWWDAILSQITDRDTFLVVLSPNAMQSRWVVEEMKIAYRQYVDLGKRLIPLRYQLSERRADWSGIHEVDFSARSYDLAFQDLIAVLGIVSTIPVSSIPEPSPRSPITQRLVTEVHVAYGHEHWQIVMDKTEVLIDRQAMEPQLWRERAVAAIALLDGNRALEACKATLQENPDDIPTLRQQALAFALLHNDTEASKTLKLAIGLTPYNEPASNLPLLQELCAILERQEQWDELLRRLDDALKLDPEAEQWALWKFRTLFAKSKQAAEGIADLDQYLLSHQETSSSFYELALQEYHDIRSNQDVYRTLLLAKQRQIPQDTLHQWEVAYIDLTAPFLTIVDPEGSVNRVVWSPDSRRVASISNYKTSFIWDITTGQATHILKGRNGNTHAIAWSPDGARLATGSSDATITIWNTSTGDLLKTFTNQSESINSLSWSPDSVHLAVGGYKNSIRVWNSTTVNWYGRQ